MPTSDTVIEPISRLSRSRRFLGGVALNYVNQAVVMLVGLWLTPFLLKHIGQHDYGLWLVGLQVLSYVMLMDFGVVALLPRETAYLTGRAIGATQEEALPVLVGRTARIVLYQTPLVAAAVAIFWFTMPASSYEFRGPIGLILIAFAALFPARIFQAVLHGLQDLAFLGRNQLFTWLLSTGIMVALVFRGFGLYALAIGWVISQVFSSGLSFARLRRRFPGVLPSRLPDLPRKALFRSLQSGFWVSMAQVAQVLLNGTDFVIIGKFLGASAVVPFSCTGKLISVLGNQPRALMENAAPGLSEMKTSESHQRLFQVSASLTQSLLVFSGLVGCVVLAVNESFVKFWVGTGQYRGLLLTAAFTVNMLLRHWNTSATYSIFCFGYERRTSITTLLDGVVTLGASVILVRSFGAIGAPVGSILGVCLVSLPGNLSALAREGRVSLLAVVLSVWPWLWRLALLAVASAALGKVWATGGVPHMAARSVCTAALYSVVMLPVVMDSPLRKYFPVQIQQRWDGLLQVLHRRMKISAC